MFSGSQKKEALIASLAIALEEALKGNGFTSTFSLNEASAAETLLFSGSREVWLRTSTWKKEAISLIGKTGVGNEVVVNLALLIRLPQQDKDVIVDSIGIANLIRKSGGYEFPFFLWDENISRFIKKIVNDTEVALRWFENFETPQQCIERISSSRRNGVGVGTDLHVAAINFLQTLS